MTSAAPLHRDRGRGTCVELHGSKGSVNYTFFDDNAVHEAIVITGKFPVALAVPLPRSNTDQFVEYLKSLPARQLATNNVVKSAEHIWGVLSAAIPKVIPPNANPLETGGLRLSWTAPGRYMHIEVADDCSVEWFYRDSPAQLSDYGISVSEMLIERLAGML